MYCVLYLNVLHTCTVISDVLFIYSVVKIVCSDVNLTARLIDDHYLALKIVRISDKEVQGQGENCLHKRKDNGDIKAKT